jgi:hypothetical protein
MLGIAPNWGAALGLVLLVGGALQAQAKTVALWKLD